MSTDHTPENWFHEAGGDHCPHGAEPADRNSEVWDLWAEHHTGSPQDVYICLEAPAGQCCGACSEEFGEAVSWEACRERPRTASHSTGERTEHERITVQVAGLECLERECEEFFTDDGDEITGKETCSHFSEMDICSGCSEQPTASGEFPAVVAWTDCAARTLTP
ncbi:hypothetical protein [Streptomyces sp. NPDC059783]|uniref:hypothetical protein n=1 Tax=Streptomyces sp. NPDC059783 TaxID=3346944 RepID=UPI0036613C94